MQLVPIHTKRNCVSRCNQTISHATPDNTLCHMKSFIKPPVISVHTIVMTIYSRNCRSFGSCCLIFVDLDYLGVVFNAVRFKYNVV